MVIKSWRLTKGGLCCLYLTYINQKVKIMGDKISMPSGMGGLVRYFDEVKSKLTFKPGLIIVLCVIVIIIMIILHLFGNRLLGI
jgi:preprotein translocase subunit Sec61beta